MNNAYSFIDYKQIVDILYEEHKKHTGKWLANVGKTHYNLKKVQVRHICSSDPNNIDGFIEKDFLNYVDDYKLCLLSLYKDIVKRVEVEVGKKIGGRIKGDDSILLKLHRKRFDDNGSFPLNKYLNDLLGFRIIDKNYCNNMKELPQYIDKLKEQKQRFMHKHRENGNYKGYHIYFMGSDAKYFPMELQVWSADNERKNFESHEIYKKDYTYWPEIYNKG
ncbi:hypothetical protein GCM10008934_02290 [Virgibacillus salarius]|uniref:hypothetical protein n=1 Tax=Virgibacillus salarius TaxID=447199 RepID=UPI0031D7438F